MMFLPAWCRYSCWALSSALAWRQPQRRRGFWGGETGEELARMRRSQKSLQGRGSKSPNTKAPLCAPAPQCVSSPASPVSDAAMLRACDLAVRAAPRPAAGPRSVQRPPKRAGAACGAPAAVRRGPRPMLGRRRGRCHAQARAVCEICSVGSCLTTLVPYWSTFDTLVICEAVMHKHVDSDFFYSVFS